MDPDLKNPRRQRGAALVVGLVLLLVLTLLAVSTMRTASLELLMAGNAQFRENAFRLAEASLADGVDQATPLLNAVPGWTLDLGTTQVNELNGEYDTRLSYLGTGDAYGGFSPKFFQFLHFQVDGTGRTDQRGARADLSMGIVRVSAKAPE